MSVKKSLDADQIGKLEESLIRIYIERAANEGMKVFGTKDPEEYRSKRFNCDNRLYVLLDEGDIVCEESFVDMAYDLLPDCLEARLYLQIYSHRSMNISGSQGSS